MTIELFGLPASGKTTAARALHEAGWPLPALSGRGEMLLRALSTHARHPWRAAAILFYILRYGGRPRAQYLIFMNLYVRAFALVHTASRMPRAVLDQGPLQLMLSLERSLSAQEARRLAALLPKPDRLFVCEVSEDERQRRLRDRGALPRAEFGAAYAEAFAASRAAAYAVAREALAGLGINVMPVTDVTKQARTLLDSAV